jgi:hypothetical protein
MNYGNYDTEGILDKPGLTGYYMEKLRKGEDFRFCGQHAKLAAQKLLEADQAFKLRNYRTLDPMKTPKLTPEEEEAAIQKAIERIPSKYTRSNVFHAVRRHLLPRNASLGEYVTVPYWFMQGWCQVGGFVVRIVDKEDGRALIIRLRDSWNSFTPDEGNGFGWRYVTLWMHNGSAASGFC